MFEITPSQVEALASQGRRPPFEAALGFARTRCPERADLRDPAAVAAAFAALDAHCAAFAIHSLPACQDFFLIGLMAGPGLFDLPAVRRFFLDAPLSDENKVAMFAVNFRAQAGAA